MYMALFDSLKNIVKGVQPQQTTSNNDTAQGSCSFCSNCGTKLNSGAKFCSGCGASVGGNVMQTPPPVPPTNDVSATSPNRRQQEYVGTVFKCSNCGCAITQTTAICPECGMRITGQSAVGSVQAFKEQLMSIESGRKKGFGGFFGAYAPADAIDVQKLTLIRNFPIPNSIDDILEFMMLAVANIDVSLSKNTWANRTSNGGMETAATIGKTISNAWVSKMQQAYQKAEITFPNDPAFKQIQKIYFDKMKELKIKV